MSAVGELVRCTDGGWMIRLQRVLVPRAYHSDLCGATVYRALAGP